MRKLTAYLLILFISIHSSFGQTALIKGNVSDTIEKKGLANSVVLLFHKSDSMMVKFTRTNASGEFLLKNIPAGDFLLMVSYPAYADYIDELHIKDSSETDLLTIPMILKRQLLQTVLVTADKGSIRIKGDTTEYKADSFKVQPGATVEDLLKKLPGIQVDKNGKITAQGETVQKILVDGEEFFGDDPTLVTQNLRADMVDKVQVFDKKSDQATFTGIDDGERQKTINLKLKEDKKNGYFGKLDGGIGTDGYYNYQAMFNAFKKKRKLSAYGILSNTGKTGLNWQENNTYGQSFASTLDYDETSGFYFSNNQSDDLESWSGQYEGMGYPTVQTAGIHYNDKWHDDKESINANYKILQLQVNGTSTTNSQNILPDTFYYNNQHQSFNNKILRNRASAIYEFQFDSTSSLKINADGGSDHKITNNAYTSEALASDSSLVNQSDRTVTTDGVISSLNSNILWRKKMHKKGRTISLNFRENYTNDNTNGYLYADNNFYINGLPSENQVVDQYKQYNNKNLLLNTKITYSEPLSPVSSLIANYGVYLDNSSSDRTSYNRGSDGKYSQIDSLYSNDYEFTIFTQQGGLSYLLSKKKLKLTAGTNVGFTDFKQTDVHANAVTTRNFINWYPQATLTYSFAQQTRISFRYNGNTTQPTIKDIQPIPNNEDPLNIYIGNPNIKPQFTNNFRISFNDYKVLAERGIYVSINGSFTEDAISSNDYVDSFGRKVYQSVNVDGNNTFNAYFGYWFKWKKPGINIDIDPSFSHNRYVNIVNTVTNATNSNNYTLGLNLNKWKEKKYGIGIFSSATFTESVSSIQEGIKTNYWTFNVRPDIDFFLPLKFQVHTDCDFNFRQKTSVFDANTNVILWNAWLGKKFLKNDVLLVKVSANDILNQNKGFNRTVTSNYISQTTNTTIQRYFMLSVVWNFTKAGTPAPQEQ